MHQDKWVVQLFTHRWGTYYNVQCSFSTEPRIMHFILCEISDDICYRMSISNIFKIPKEILRMINPHVPFQRGFKYALYYYKARTFSKATKYKNPSQIFNVHWQNMKRRVGYSANLEGYYNMNTAITMTMYLVIVATGVPSLCNSTRFFSFCKTQLGLVHIRPIAQA